MPDAYFEDEYLADLYDRIEVRNGPDEQFYFALARRAGRVLDVGCGTGAMLHHLRDTGHTGRLVGVDPAAGMLARARRRDDIEWVQTYLADAGFRAGFDLAYMTGHAFQVLLDDDAARELFEAVRKALVPGGRFAFESRNPSARAWEGWKPDGVSEVRDRDGRMVRVWHEVEEVTADPDPLVTFTETFAVDGEAEPRVSRSTLRFPRESTIDRLLADAGLVVEARHGWWDGAPFTAGSREIVTVAMRR
ncbi:class I SAM-dependent methyltransferase [Jatrophihabitans fulvus]